MQSKDTSVIYRSLISGILHLIDDKSLGNLNADLIQEKFEEKIKACKGKT
jgi:hypothetical protein